MLSRMQSYDLLPEAIEYIAMQPGSEDGRPLTVGSTCIFSGGVLWICLLNLFWPWLCSRTGGHCGNCNLTYVLHIVQVNRFCRPLI